MRARHAQPESKSAGERERERERETETERDRERDRETERDRQTDRRRRGVGGRAREGGWGGGRGDSAMCQVSISLQKWSCKYEKLQSQKIVPVEHLHHLPPSGTVRRQPRANRRGIGRRHKLSPAGPLIYLPSAPQAKFDNGQAYTDASCRIHTGGWPERHWDGQILVFR